MAKDLITRGIDLLERKRRRQALESLLGSRDYGVEGTLDGYSFNVGEQILGSNFGWAESPEEPRRPGRDGPRRSRRLGCPPRLVGRPPGPAARALLSDGAPHGTRSQSVSPHVLSRARLAFTGQG